MLRNRTSDLLARFEQTGIMQDLDEAVYYSSLELCPPGHPKRSISFLNVVNAVSKRFEQMGATL